ncbi:MAG: hypothetical protein KJO32_01500, partial [Deltaproteobacteria bacterium]|nr:hypothetical protein [Deltaproteobacteria bacterium]
MAETQTPRSYQPAQGDYLMLRPHITEEQRLQKKKLIRRVILFCLCLIPLFTWLQGRLFDQSLDLPVNSNILIFALINL